MRPAARPFAAWILLSAFAVGGVVAPVVHRVAHAVERQADLAHDSTDHHHDGVAVSHGAEAQPPCPKALDSDWTCTLCNSPSAQAIDTTAIAGDVQLSEISDDTSATGFPRTVVRATSARGPPSV